MSITSMTLILGLYIAVVIGLGYLGYRHTNSTQDYLVAGRSAHPFIMALAYGSTFISTSAIIGFGGAAAFYGMGVLWLTVLNILVGIFLAFIVFGKPTSRLGHQLGVHTFPELLGKHYDSPFMQKMAALVILIAMPLYAAAVMIGGARFIESTTILGYTWGLIIFALIVGGYVMIGGLKGVIYTDAFQAIIMFIGMLILIVFTYDKLGGVVGAHQALTNLSTHLPESLSAKGHQGWTSMPALGSEYWWTLISTLVAGVGIGVLAQPQLVVRYLTVQGARELNRAVSIGGVFILFMTGVAFVVGALSNVYFMDTTGQIALTASIDPVVGQPNIDAIIPLYITKALPPWFSYIFMLTLLSAAMSTLSGQFHVIGSSLSFDLFQKNNLTLNRVAILVALAVTVYLAFRLPLSIIAVTTAIFFGICAACFLPAYTAALFWPRVTKVGAIASMVSGFVISLFLLVFVHAKESASLGLAEALTGQPSLVGAPWCYIDPILISLPLSAIILVVVSLLTKPVEQHIQSSVVYSENT